MLQWPRGQKRGLLFEAVLAFLRPQTLPSRVEDQGIFFCKNNEETESLGENPLSFERSKHIDDRYHFIRDLGGTGRIRIVHVDSGWQHTHTFHTLTPSTCSRGTDGC